MRLAFAYRGSLVSPGNVKRSSTDVFPPPPTDIADPRPGVGPGARPGAEPGPEQGAPALEGAIAADGDHAAPDGGSRAAVADPRLPDLAAAAAAADADPPGRGRGPPPRLGADRDRKSG